MERVEYAVMSESGLFINKHRNTEDNILTTDMREMDTWKEAQGAENMIQIMSEFSPEITGLKVIPVKCSKTIESDRT